MIANLFRKDKEKEKEKEQPQVVEASARNGGGSKSPTQAAIVGDLPTASPVPHLTSVRVSKYRFRGNIVEYVVDCSNGHTSWQVYRRYQQFKALDQQLKLQCTMISPYHCDSGVIPVLTGSHWTEVTNQSPQLVERRRRFLDIYLQQLAVPSNLFYASKSVFYKFLHDGEVTLPHKGKESRPLPGFSTFEAQLTAPEGPAEEGEHLKAWADDVDDECYHCAAVQAAVPGEESAPSGEAEAMAKSSESGVALLPTSQPCRAVDPATLPVTTDRHSDLPTVVVAIEGSGETTDKESGAVSRTAADASNASEALEKCTKCGHASRITYALEEWTPDGRCRGCKQLSVFGLVYAEDLESRAPAMVAPSAAGDRGDDAVPLASRAPTHSTPMAATILNRERRLGRKVEYRDSTVTQASAAGLSQEEDYPSEEDTHMDERAPPRAPNCLQCNAEFSSILFPHRCYLCNNRFCRSCLSVRDLEGEVVAKVCRQCSENIDRQRGSRVNPPLEEESRGPCAEAVTHIDPHADTRSDGTAKLTEVTTAICSGSKEARPIAADAGCASAAEPASPVRGTVDQAPALPSGTGSVSAPVDSAPASPSVPGTVGGDAEVPCATTRRNTVRGDVVLSDFQLVTTLGRGTFGKVMKVIWRGDGKVYAMKVLNKCVIYKRRMVDYIKEEKGILSFLPPHPFVVSCHFAFQTEYYVYFVMDYLPGGELYSHVYPKLLLRSADVRLYIAELILALEHLHHYDVVHRDVKLENIVLNADGHVTLTDFGLARKNFSHSRRRSFVGSAEYLAPETIQGEYQTKAVDWWSVGVMLYEMLCGTPPFHAKNNNEVFLNVLQKPLDFTAPCFTPAAVSLISQLLHRDVKLRLSEPSKIKAHAYFQGLDWDAVAACKVLPSFLPNLSDNDTKYFKKEFTAEWALIPTPGGVSRQTLDLLKRRFSNFQFIHGADSLPQQPNALSIGTHMFLSGQPSSESQLVNPLRCVGVWKLVKVELVTVDGRVSYPWGSEVRGILVYQSNGFYALQLCPIRRLALKSHKIECASREELSEVYCSYVASFGTYAISAEKRYVTHIPTGNLCPNLVDKTVRHHFELLNQGNFLRIATPPLKVSGGVIAQTVLTFRRIAEVA